MILKHGRIFDRNFDLRGGEVAFGDGRITRVAPEISGGPEMDVSGCMVAPGFVDIHIHGCDGADTCDGTRAAIETMASGLVRHGVTSFCPTTMTVPPEQIGTALLAVKSCMEDRPDGASVRGVNMEGPYISPKRIGAQKSECVRRPDADEFRGLYDLSGGIVRLVDIAPEMDGAEEFIRRVSPYCRISLAHSTADYDAAVRAFSLGISHATHLFNAMTGMNHRAPGAVGAVFDTPSVAAEMICDGFHIHPAVLRTAFRALGEDRTVIISDSMRAAGLSDGDFDLGGQTVHVRSGRALLTDGTIAGSTTNLGDEVANLVRFGVPVRQVIRSATINPAREIGAADEIGSIEEGKSADFTILNPDFSLRAVIVRGKLAWKA